MSFTYFHHNRPEKARIRTLLVLSLLGLSTVFSSCDKNEQEGYPATMQVFNALDDGLALYTNLSGAHPIRYNASLQIRNKLYDQRNNLLYLDKPMQRVEFYSSKDTMPDDRPVLSVEADLQKSGIYSLFLFHEKSNAASLLVKDNVPPINRSDSSTHLRFANFSETQSISVNIKGAPNGSFVANLAYKSMSDFVELEANVSVQDYIFEIREQATGNLLGSFTTTGLNPRNNFPGAVNNWIFKSNTLVFTGKPGAAFPNNYRTIVMNHR
ncbi:hypothetical protein [Pseudobacter ginsenosidimutans]|uniref:DUF4397 domain-containing protein n=1 Tax=Pseudobacter ginsenosidimutans TaxID=661488 RepID=A0A4Q7N5A6_9BACT|nr:hypothetical protein [Pseudobacter ginsenosidimutans]QEC44728.1 hypothetical protein FSB84_24710 [Pseudobacter ginsenosidimutans]RZS76209.1 hypothetical protein EV199_2088 [Pseudobacter ginsenosidimutans]